MPAQPYRRRTQQLSGLFGALGIIAGAIVLWWDSRRLIVIPEASELPISEEQLPSPWLFSTAGLSGEILLVLGFAALCLSLGMLLARKPAAAGFTGRAGWLIIGLGFALLLGGAGVLLWDATRAVEFGWFAYAPMTGSTFSSLTTSGAQISGKLLLALGAGLAALGTGLKSAAGGRRVSR